MNGITVNGVITCHAFKLGMGSEQDALQGFCNS